MGVLPSPSFAEGKIDYDQKKVYLEINNNWFNDDYILKKRKVFFDEACEKLLKGASKKAIKKCKSPNKYSADLQRAAYCVFYIAREWPNELLGPYKEEIKDDCKRLYFNHKDDTENFLPQGFSNKYIAFVKGKRLPFYDGDYVDGLQSGFGAYYYENGNKYVGEFEGGTFQGKGKYFYKSGNLRVIMEGYWTKGRMGGLGTMKSFKNNIYDGQFVGEFVQNKLDGRVIQFDAKGKIVNQGIFKNGQLIEPRKIDLNKLLKENKSSKMKLNNKHENCLKASDYKGCMDYQNR